MQPPFVKKFDFRGIYNKDIVDKDAFYLGLAINNVLSPKKVLVGWDTRVASMSLALNFINALQDKHIEIHYLESCPIDYVTVGAAAFDFDFSVMFTGSHNTWEWTGLLMHTKCGDSVEGELVTKIIENYNETAKTEYKEPRVNILDFHNFQQELETVYKEKIQSLIPIEKIQKMKVVVDLGDGSGSKALDILDDLLPQVTFARLNDRLLYDGETPHQADPSNKENMQQLIRMVTAESYDCGFAFDSDADRALAVDETGEYINGSIIGSAMVDVFTSLDSEMKSFGYAVECGPSMRNAIVDQKKNGADISVTPVPVGRSILRRLIREEKVAVAVENVGHFYINDFFKTDSGAFTIVIMLYWISTHGKLSTLREKHPEGKREYFHTPQAPDQEKKLQELADEINPHFSAMQSKKITEDGLRFEFYDGEYLKTWYAIRKSGYEKIEKFYFGSLDDEDFSFLQTKLKPTG